MFSDPLRSRKRRAMRQRPRKTFSATLPSTLTFRSLRHCALIGCGMAYGSQSR